MKKTMGQIIAETRKAKGMTQLELAQKMGVTDKAVSKWERDLSCPDVGSLPQLAEVLGLSVEALMQCKSAKTQNGQSWGEIVDTALKGVGLAMGISVVVLSILDQLYLRNGMIMLGIGIACISLSLLKKEAAN